MSENPPRKRKTPKLNPRQALFVKYYIEHSNGAKAAKLAGYNAKHPSAAANALLNIPQVRNAIADHKAKLRKQTGYHLDKAMQEAGDAADFARARNNAMALVKAIELRAKLAGLLIEKHDVNVNVVSISSALEAASRRVVPLLLEAKPVEEEPPPDIEIEVKESEPSGSAEGS